MRGGVGRKLPRKTISGFIAPQQSYLTFSDYKWYPCVCVCVSIRRTLLTFRFCWSILFVYWVQSGSKRKRESLQTGELEETELLDWIEKKLALMSCGWEEEEMSLYYICREGHHGEGKLCGEEKVASVGPACWETECWIWNRLPPGLETETSKKNKLFCVLSAWTIWSFFTQRDGASSHACARGERESAGRWEMGEREGGWPRNN